MFCTGSDSTLAWTWPSSTMPRQKCSFFYFIYFYFIFYRFTLPVSRPSSTTARHKGSAACSHSSTRGTPRPLCPRLAVLRVPRSWDIRSRWGNILRHSAISWDIWSRWGTCIWSLHHINWCGWLRQKMMVHIEVFKTENMWCTQRVTLGWLR